MHTFYVPPSQIDAEIATITGSEQHHLRNVLRITSGETIRIIDGQGNVYTAEILDTSTNRSSSIARIQTHECRAPLSPTLTLFQGLPKNDKMEMILQKTTELGVTQIVPLHSERALQKPSQNRYERWHRVLISATKQCKRAWLPELSEAQQFETSLSQLEKFSLRFLFSPHAEGQHIKTVLRETPDPNAIALFVGPEGGFSDQEITAGIKNGCVPVTLGRNILRTETAAITAVAVTTYEFF
ncbi:MAG: RsmE family RNA methyltransferase [Candidatus Poribacteria bacterium]|nr:RsmE family RNA methyltransferase [Candidatus Poribacteria bacterium]MYK20486.1 16S rRNA (uracil(1498)-N(3))-methyltransferase [Candidatus Poribacteria bacterium]